MSLKKNTLWNFAGNSLPLLIGIFTVPYILKNIGMENFGILTIVWAVVGYFSLFDFGLGRALTHSISLARNRNDDASIKRLIKKGLLITALSGILGGFFLASLSDVIVSKWITVTPASRATAALSLVLAGVAVPLATMTSGLRGVLEAYERFSEANLLRMALGVLNFVLPAISILFKHPSLPSIITLLIVARLLTMSAHGVLVAAFCWPRTAAKISDNRDNLFSLGMWMTISNIISPIMVTSDRFLIAKAIGASVLSYYTIPMDILAKILIIPISLSGALFPKLTALRDKRDSSAHFLYARSFIFLTGTLLAICLASVFFSKSLFKVWLGDSFSAHATLPTQILSIGIFFNGLAALPFTDLQATGNARTIALIHSFELICYIPLVLALTTNYGITGAATAWTLRVFVDFFVLLFLSNSTKALLVALPSEANAAITKLKKAVTRAARVR